MFDRVSQHGRRYLAAVHTIDRRDIEASEKMVDAQPCSEGNRRTSILQHLHAHA